MLFVGVLLPGSIESHMRTDVCLVILHTHVYFIVLPNRETGLPTVPVISYSVTLS